MNGTNEYDANHIKNEQADGRPGPRRHRRLRRAGALAAAGAGVLLLAAACGNGGSSTATPPASPTSATPAPAATSAPPAAAAETTAYQQAVAFARCIRAHGEQAFPDPAPDGTFPAGVDMASVRYLSAAQACEDLLPKGEVLAPVSGQEAHRLLVKYAACMRAHGVRRFPDPRRGDAEAHEAGYGYLSVRALHTTLRQFNSASRACRKFQPGGSRA